MSETSATDVDRFASRADDFGVSVSQTAPDAAAETIGDLLEPPSVATPLPWDDVALPDAVTTDPTPAQLDAATTGVTAAGLAIADYGSLLLRATPDGSEPVSLFPDLHVAVLRASDIVPDMETALSRFGEDCRDRRQSAIVATGPSATADMGALVRGAHGPTEVHVVVVR